jgi:hypothetical protein
MFCPQCSAENNLRQKYCRRCGLQLTAALIALRGSADDALARYLKGGKLLAVGSIFLIFSVLATLANITHSSGPWNYAVIINLLLGLLITVPAISVGIVRMRRARRALELEDDRDQLGSESSQGKKRLTASARPIDGLLSPAGAPASIAEGTTRHLTTPSG